MRTFSKAYGLAGLRVGYMLGPAELVRALGRVRNVFDVTGPAQAAALASLADGDAHLPERVAHERRRAGDGGRGPARARRRAAAEHGQLPADRPRLARARPGGERGACSRAGVIVRPARAFGAPAAIRVTIGLPDENARFLAAAAEALAEAG